MMNESSLNCMISLQVPRDELITRMLERASKQNRADDKNIEIINYRLQEYEDKTKPVADFYNELGKYYPIDGTGELAQVFNRIDQIIQKSLENERFNFVLYGPPGAGKGTQSKLLAEKYGLVYISTGELIRDEIKKDSEMGRIAKPYLAAGNVVPDEIAVKLIEQKIAAHSNARGFIFKGFPLTIAQAYIFDGILKRHNTSLSAVIEITSPTLLSIKRLTARSKSSSARLYDMDMEVIIHRLEVFEQRTSILKDYYSKRNILQTICGDGEAEEVFLRLSDVIERKFKNLR